MFIERLEQICIEDTYNRDQIRDLVHSDIKDSDIQDRIQTASDALYAYFDKEYSYDSKNVRLDAVLAQDGFSIDKLIEEIMIIVIPEEKPVQIQAMAGKLAPFFKFENIWDGIKTAAEVLVVACESDIYDIIPASNTSSGSIEVKSNFVLSPETRDKIDVMQYLPPLVCKPGKIYRNYQSAYLTKEDSIILGKGNHHEEKQALDAINIANSVALSLDEEILKIEEPLKFKKPAESLASESERIKSMQRLINSSKRVYQQMLDVGNKFFLSWKFDKRGRMYSMGYHVNIQSTEYKKALINLANKQVIRLD